MRQKHNVNAFVITHCLHLISLRIQFNAKLTNIPHAVTVQYACILMVTEVKKCQNYKSLRQVSS